jgi:hypothetical protein
MTERGVAPSAVTFNVLIKACAAAARRASESHGSQRRRGAAQELLDEVSPQPTRPRASASPPPSLPYKVDTSRPSLRNNWTHQRAPRARRGLTLTRAGRRSGCSRVCGRPECGPICTRTTRCCPRAPPPPRTRASRRAWGCARSSRCAKRSASHRPRRSPAPAAAAPVPPTVAFVRTMAVWPLAHRHLPLTATCRSPPPAARRAGFP